MESLLYRALGAFMLLAATACAQGGSRGLCGQVPTIASELTRISGMKLKHAVPCDFITKDKVNEFLKKRVKDDSSPEELRAEELTLKKFGFVPQDYNLAQSTIDLLTEQAAAFYDYNKKKLFITESDAKEPQEPVLAHELSHALADQNFNLSKFVKAGRKSDDGSSARLAVMEGQATWLMSEFLALQSGQSLKTSPELVARMSGENETADGQYPVYDKAPLYLRETLLFPYTKGMLFQDALVHRDQQQAFAEVFRHPPLSTQQIIHPDKYFSGVAPTDPALPEVKLGHGYKGLVGGSLGELEHTILLEQYDGKPEAAAVAGHWRGCNFELRENKKAGRVVLLYSSEWDSEDMARRFFHDYRKVLGKKWKKLKTDSETADRVAGTGDDGRFVLERKGAVVTSVEGLDPAN